MNKLKNIILSLFLLSVINSAAQKIKPLKIGDAVPDLQFTMLSPNGKKSIVKLSDYKGKLVILDFWATWCKACIRALPKMDSLQKKFDQELEVLMVNTTATSDDEKKLNAFYEKWVKKFPKFQLSTTIKDSVSRPYFPHTGVPHYVWIGSDGKIKAI